VQFETLPEMRQIGRVIHYEERLRFGRIHERYGDIKSPMMEQYVCWAGTRARIAVSAGE
jgi:hypothetical protein